MHRWQRLCSLDGSDWSLQFREEKKLQFGNLERGNRRFDDGEEKSLEGVFRGRG